MQTNFAVDANQPQARGFAQSGVRVANERAVLTLIVLRPGSSNADLARLSGLGAQTTSRIVSELEARDLIKRGEVLRGRRGQPATPLFINPEGAFVIGVEIGWSSLEVVLLSLSGQILVRTSRSHAYPNVDAVLAAVAGEIATLRSGMTPWQRERLIGIGLASPGCIGSGVAALGAPPEQVERWGGIDLAERVASVTGLDVERFNNGSAACWGEWLALPMPWPATFACLHVGTYLGTGITSNGNLWDGRAGGSADLGAIIVSDAEGRPARVQDVASLLALQRRLEATGRSLPAGSPATWDWAALGPVADLWLDDAARALAIAILGTCALIDLDLTVIDGVMPKDVVARLVERVRHHLSVLPSSGANPTVTSGALGSAAAASGVGQLLLFRRYFSRAWNMFAT